MSETTEILEQVFDEKLVLIRELAIMAASDRDFTLYYVGQILGICSTMTNRHKRYFPPNQDKARDAEGK